MFGNAFKPRAHYVYNYQPRYYDERKERLENLKRKYENGDDSSNGAPTLSLSKEKLKSDWKRHKKLTVDKGVNRRLAVIIAILIGVSAYIFELHKLF